MAERRRFEEYMSEYLEEHPEILERVRGVAYGARAAISRVRGRVGGPVEWVTDIIFEYTEEHPEVAERVRNDLLKTAEISEKVKDVFRDVTQPAIPQFLQLADAIKKGTISVKEGADVLKLYQVAAQRVPQTQKEIRALSLATIKPLEDIKAVTTALGSAEKVYVKELGKTMYLEEALRVLRERAAGSIAARSKALDYMSKKYSSLSPNLISYIYESMRESGADKRVIDFKLQKINAAAREVDTYEQLVNKRLKEIGVTKTWTQLSEEERQALLQKDKALRDAVNSLDAAREVYTEAIGPAQDFIKPLTTMEALGKRYARLPFTKSMALWRYMLENTSPQFRNLQERMVEVVPATSEFNKEVINCARAMTGLPPIVDETSVTFETIDAAIQRLRDNAARLSPISKDIQNLAQSFTTVTKPASELGSATLDTTRQQLLMHPVIQRGINLLQSFGKPIEDNIVAFTDWVKSLKPEEFNTLLSTLLSFPDATTRMQAGVSDLTNDIVFMVAKEKESAKATRDWLTELMSIASRAPELSTGLIQWGVLLAGNKKAAQALSRSYVPLTTWMENVAETTRYNAKVMDDVIDRTDRATLAWSNLSDEEKTFVIKTKTNFAKWKKLSYDLYPVLQALIAEQDSLGFAQKISAKEYESLSKQIAKAILKQRELKDRQQESHKTAIRFGKALERLGWQTGFYGWIVTYAGRSIINYIRMMSDAIMDLVKTGANWEKNIVQIAETLALLQATGEATPEVIQMLNRSLAMNIKEGLRWQAALGLLQTAITQLKLEILTAALPAIFAFGRAFASWLQTEDARTIIIALAQTVAQAIGVFAYFIQSVVSTLPVIMTAANMFLMLIKVLGPLAPVLMVVGMVLWMLGPAFTAVAKAIQVVVWLSDKENRAMIMNILLSYKSMKAKLADAIATLKLAFSTKSATAATYLFASGLKTLLSALLPVLAVIGVVAAAFWMFSATTKSAIRYTIPAITTFNDTFTDAFAEAADFSEAFRKQVVDDTGKVVYTIDTMTGTVKDSTGTIIGKYDAMTGVIRDDSGNIVGYVDTVNDVFVTVKGEVYKVEEAFSTSFSKMTEATSKLTETMNEWLGVVKKTPYELLNTYIESKRLEEAWKGVEETASRFISSLRELPRPAPLIENAEKFVNTLRDLVEQGIFTSRQLEYIRDNMQQLMLESIKGTDALISFLKKLEASTTITDEQRQALELLRKALESLCFRHATPQAAMFAEELTNLNGILSDTIQLHGKLTDALASPIEARVGAGVGAAYTGGEVRQAITVYSYITIESVSSSVDLDLLTDAVNRGISEALRRRGV